MAGNSVHVPTPIPLESTTAFSSSLGSVPPLSQFETDVSPPIGHAAAPLIHDERESDRRSYLNEFNSLSITEVLDQDSRPTFVIDLDPDQDPPDSADDGFTLVFCNLALRLHERLSDTIAGKFAADNDATELKEPKSTSRSTYEEFRAWATGVTKFDDSKDVFPLSFFFADLLWTGSTVSKRWRLISGTLFNPGMLSYEPSVVSSRESRESLQAQTSEISPSLRASMVPTSVSATNTAATTFDVSSSRKSSYIKRPETRSDSTSHSSQTMRIALATPETVVTDWTSPNPKGMLSAHLALVRSVPWDTTPLGPMESWSPELRQVANLVMANSHPAMLCWGSELTMLYNERYAEMVGHKHPRLMGTGFSGPFSEIWEALADDLAECARTGIGICKTDDEFSIERHGFLEETYYSWSWTPLYGGTERIVGFYSAPFETTSTVLRHRRMQSINKIGGNFARAKSRKQFWSLLLQALDDNERDVPVALLYSVGDGDGDGNDIDQESTSSGSNISLKSCYLEGSLGIPEGHPAALPQLDLKRSLDGFVPAFREAMRTREPTLLQTRDGSLSERLLNGINWRGHGEPCTEAVIFPIRPTNGDLVMAFLVLGVNPRRPYDREYEDFTHMLNRQFATSLAAFMLYEEEVRRNRYAAEAAALESEQLTQELALQISRQRRMTELSPLGMYLFSPEGVILEANDRWYEMTGHPRDEFWEKSFLQVVDDTSQKAVEAGWERLTVERLPWTCELQLKKLTVRPVNLNGEDIEYWVLVTAHPEIGPDGSLRSIMGSLTEISHLKWAQGLQNRRLLEAEETRRQQNEFIDITSHEMRNPLSAILQCTDDIITTLDSRRLPLNPPALGDRESSLTVEDLDGCLEAARIISLCVQHQKSIVDDILTVSKLDSNLLVITPIPAQPIEVVRKALKMFDPELQAKDIQMICETHASMEALSIDWLTFDPSRVLQILLNLITNAIKFTAGCPKRIIKVILSASREPPLVSTTTDLQYIPARTANSHTVSGEYGRTDEFLYLGFEVKDTGCGITQKEKRRLFERFSQASPRTHAQYGGSGLGLFISRQLTELQGGQVGVASEAGTGSTFGFFVKASRPRPPSSPGKIITPLLYECEMDITASLSQSVAPQREGLASSCLIEEFVATNTKAIPKFDPRDLQVLVVEDNMVNQTVLVKQLRKYGLGVGVANDGIEALAFLEGTEFRRPLGRRLSVILMDLEMPNMDGLTCVREIRKMEENGDIVSHVPVIAVTANVRDEQVSAARRSGMDDIVSKPFHIPDLLKRIETLLGAIVKGPMVSDAYKF